MNSFKTPKSWCYYYNTHFYRRGIIGMVKLVAELGVPPRQPGSKLCAFIITQESLVWVRAHGLPSGAARPPTAHSSSRGEVTATRTGIHIVDSSQREDGVVSGQGDLREEKKM